MVVKDIIIDQIAYNLFFLKIIIGQQSGEDVDPQANQASDKSN